MTFIDRIKPGKKTMYVDIDRAAEGQHCYCAGWALVVVTPDGLIVDSLYLDDFDYRDPLDYLTARVREFAKSESGGEVWFGMMSSGQFCNPQEPTISTAAALRQVGEYWSKENEG